jgi:integrase
MEWDDVDEADGWWTIPGTKAKNGKTHRVPLTTAALALLAEARADGSGPLVCDTDGWVFLAQRGGSNREQAANVISRLRHAGLLTGDYTRHDLRRTVITTLAKLGIPRAVLSQVLNHTDRGPRATAIYYQDDYDTEKRKALEKWGRYLDDLLTGHTPRVVPFSGRRR